MVNKLFICKVCGYNYGDYIWGKDGMSPTFEICPCCGTEFGYQDSNKKAILSQRQRWFSKDNEWHYPEEKPKNWCLEDNISNLVLLNSDIFKDYIKIKGTLTRRVAVDRVNNEIVIFESAKGSNIPTFHGHIRPWNPRLPGDNILPEEVKTLLLKKELVNQKGGIVKK